MSERSAREHARRAIATYLPMGDVRLVARAPDRSRSFGWRKRIAPLIARELDKMIERHYRFWAKHYVLEAMEPGVTYDSTELRALTGVNRKQVKAALTQLSHEGSVEPTGGGRWRRAAS